MDKNTTTVTVTGAPTPRSSKITWNVRVNGKTMFGSFDRKAAEAYAEMVRSVR